MRIILTAAYLHLLILIPCIVRNDKMREYTRNSPLNSTKRKNVAAGAVVLKICIPFDRVTRITISVRSRTINRYQYADTEILGRIRRQERHDAVYVITERKRYTYEILFLLKKFANQREVMHFGFQDSSPFLLFLNSFYLWKNTELLYKLAVPVRDRWRFRCLERSPNYAGMYPNV